MKLKERLHEFICFLRNEERSEATVEKYTHDMHVFFDFAEEREINRECILAYKDKLGSTYAVSSANSMIAALNSFLRFCGLHALCVKQFRVQREAFCAEEKELTRAEYLRLLEAARERRGERLSLILESICATGIRVSELQYITVQAAEKGEATVRCKGKNRRIFIVPKLQKKLLRYAKEQKITEGAIFISKRKKPISRHNIWREMKKLCERACVSPKKVFPHNLRHLFARTFYGMEKDIAKLADILGHASVNTTRIYIVTTGAEHRRKMEHMRLIL